MLRTAQIAAMALVLVVLPQVAKSAIDEALQKKIDAKVAEIKGWASSADIVSAVKAQNDNPSADNKSMTNDKWKELSKLDPFVKSLSTNAVSKFLKTKKDDIISEAFVNSADGSKVALLTKTSKWIHKGNPKHDKPMAGQTWQGEVEVDESTGIKQLQIAVPVMDGDKPVGSLVIGLSINKLES